MSIEQTDPSTSRQNIPLAPEAKARLSHFDLADASKLTRFDYEKNPDLFSNLRMYFIQRGMLSMERLASPVMQHELKNLNIHVTEGPQEDENERMMHLSDIQSGRPFIDIIQHYVPLDGSKPVRSFDNQDYDKASTTVSVAYYPVEFVVGSTLRTGDQPKLPENTTTYVSFNDFPLRDKKMQIAFTSAVELLRRSGGPPKGLAMAIYTMCQDLLPYTDKFGMKTDAQEQLTKMAQALQITPEVSTTEKEYEPKPIRVLVPRNRKR